MEYINTHQIVESTDYPFDAHHELEILKRIMYDEEIEVDFVNPTGRIIKKKFDEWCSEVFKGMENYISPRKIERGDEYPFSAWCIYHVKQDIINHGIDDVFIEVPYLYSEKNDKFFYYTMVNKDKLDTFLEEYYPGIKDYVYVKEAADKTCLFCNPQSFINHLNKYKDRYNDCLYILNDKIHFIHLHRFIQKSKRTLMRGHTAIDAIKSKFSVQQETIDTFIEHAKKWNFKALQYQEKPLTIHEGEFEKWFSRNV